MRIGAALSSPPVVLAVPSLNWILVHVQDAVGDLDASMDAISANMAVVRAQLSVLDTSVNTVDALAGDADVCCSAHAFVPTYLGGSDTTFVINVLGVAICEAIG